MTTRQAALPLPGYAFTAFLFFSFLTLSRFHEALHLLLHMPTYLYTISVALLAPAIFITGRWSMAWGTTPGRLFLALSVWMLVGFPFSVWRGGAFKVLKDDWLMAMFTFMVVGGMISTFREMRRTFYVAGFSMCVVLLMFLRFERVDVGGRVSMSGTLGNANDLAMHLLIGLPILIYVFMDQRRMSFTRIAAVGSSLVLTFVLIRTGSRAGLLGFAALIGALFMAAPFAAKLKLLVGGGVLIAVLAATAPDSIVNRYSTLFQDETGSANEAVASSAGRKALLKESIRQTFLHPLFGLGPGNFMIAYAKELEQRGIMYGRYRVSHNTYTEVSSETGIPGFIFFMWAMIWCFRTTRRIYKRARLIPEQRDLANVAFYLFLSLLTFSVTTFFGSNAYRFYFPLLAGLAVSLQRVSEQFAPATLSTPLKTR